LPADLLEDPTYALNSYNWISFGTREFDARPRVRYLGDIDYFDRELAVNGDDKGDVDEDEDAEDNAATEAKSTRPRRTDMSRRRRRPGVGSGDPAAEHWRGGGHFHHNCQ
jgi:hypothetical protein